MGFTTLLPGGGPTTLLASSSTGPGPWFRIHPRARKITVSIMHTGTSVGTTVQSTSYVQVSNDGVNPLLTTGGTTVDALATIIHNGGSPQVSGFSFDAAWGWIRGNINALSTGTITMIANAAQGGGA